MVPLRDVDWIEAEGNYARIWTGGRSHLLREPLRALEARARAHGFVRAHRRALVRVDAVRELTETRGRDVTAVLATGARIPVSRRRRRAFASAIKARTD